MTICILGQPENERSPITVPTRRPETLGLSDSKCVRDTVSSAWTAMVIALNTHSKFSRMFPEPHQRNGGDRTSGRAIASGGGFKISNAPPTHRYRQGV